MPKLSAGSEKIPGLRKKIDVSKVLYDMSVNHKNEKEFQADLRKFTNMFDARFK